MPPNPDQTFRQRMLELLHDQEWSAWELSQTLHIPIREVETHLGHLIKTVKRFPDKTFQVVPSFCLDCGFIFQNRQRLTQPSRCPKCRGESTAPPRFTIIPSPSTKTR